MGILEDIDNAAYDIMAGRVGNGFLPVAKNFNIAANHNHPVLDWDALYKARRADNAPALINVREVA